jgi:hypothetical protein
MTLEIERRRIKPGHWGWSAGSELPAQLDRWLGLANGPSGPPALIRCREGPRRPTGNCSRTAALESAALVIACA